jgi:hypothetical protein
MAIYFNNSSVNNLNMQKPIRLKEVNRFGQRVRSIKEHLNNNQTQIIGASALDPKTAKIKALVDMFHLSDRF